MDLTQKIGAAINANNGQCPVIEDALVNAMDFVMARTATECKPSITVQSVFGQSRIEMTDGVNVVTLDVTREGVRRLIGELTKVVRAVDDDAVGSGEPITERLDHLECLVNTISDEINWVRARDQIREIRSWVKQRETADSVR